MTCPIFNLLQNFDEENFYDEETQSISNYARYAVKRASF